MRAPGRDESRQGVYERRLQFLFLLSRRPQLVFSLVEEHRKSKPVYAITRREAFRYSLRVHRAMRIRVFVNVEGQCRGDLSMPLEGKLLRGTRKRRLFGVRTILCSRNR